MITQQTFERLGWKTYFSDYLDNDYKYFNKENWMITCDYYTSSYDSYVVKMIEKAPETNTRESYATYFRGTLYSEKELINVLDLINRK